MAMHKPKANKATHRYNQTATLRHKQTQPHSGIRNSHLGTKDSYPVIENGHSSKGNSYSGINNSYLSINQQPIGQK